jgi:hypothetical protein
MDQGAHSACSSLGRSDLHAASQATGSSVGVAKYLACEFGRLFQLYQEAPVDGLSSRVCNCHSRGTRAGFAYEPLSCIGYARRLGTFGEGCRHRRANTPDCQLTRLARDVLHTLLL